MSTANQAIKPTRTVRASAVASGSSAATNTASRRGCFVTIPSRDLLDQPSHLVGAAPRQGDACAAVTIAVDDRPSVSTRLDLESDLGTAGPKAHPMAQHRGARQLRYEPGRAGQNALRQRRIGSPIPLVDLVRPTDHDVAGTGNHIGDVVGRGVQPHPVDSDLLE